MSRETPAQVARALLLKLLAQVDRGGRDSVPIGERSAHAYFALRDLGEGDALHALLESAQAAGGVTLEWGRGAAAQDLRRIRIRDPDQLAAWLGVSRAATQARAILQGLESLMTEAPGWLRDAYADALRQWRRGGAPYRIPGADTARAVNLFKAARAVAAGEQKGLDLRCFGVHLLGDPKALDTLLDPLGTLLRRNPDWSSWEDDTGLFRALGLEKFPPPLFIKGPLVLDYDGVIWDLQPLRPFVALSPDAVRGIQVNTQVPYLMTIENLASFQRQVREVEDHGVVICTAGYPAPALVRILNWLDQVLPADCPCYHWGDRDLGGLRTYDRVAATCGHHRVLPHLMTVPDPIPDPEEAASLVRRGQVAGVMPEASRRSPTGPGSSSSPHPGFRPLGRGWTRDELRALVQTGATKGAAGDLARMWLALGLAPLEQEALDPSSPLAAPLSPYAGPVPEVQP